MVQCIIELQEAPVPWNIWCFDMDDVKESWGTLPYFSSAILDIGVNAGYQNVVCLPCMVTRYLAVSSYGGGEGGSCQLSLSACAMLCI